MPIPRRIFTTPADPNLAFIREHARHRVDVRLYIKWRDWNNIKHINGRIRFEQKVLKHCVLSDPEATARVMRKLKLLRRRFGELKRGTFNNGRPAIRAEFTRSWPDDREYPVLFG